MSKLKNLRQITEAGNEAAKVKAEINKSHSKIYKSVTSKQKRLLDQIDKLGSEGADLLSIHITSILGEKAAKVRNVTFVYIENVEVEDATYGEDYGSWDLKVTVRGRTDKGFKSIRCTYSEFLTSLTVL